MCVQHFSALLGWTFALPACNLEQQKSAANVGNLFEKSSPDLFGLVFLSNILLPQG